MKTLFVEAKAKRSPDRQATCLPLPVSIATTPSRAPWSRSSVRKARSVSRDEVATDVGVAGAALVVGVAPAVGDAVGDAVVPLHPADVSAMASTTAAADVFVVHRMPPSSLVRRPGTVAA